MSANTHMILCDDFPLHYQIRGEGDCTIVVGSHVYYPRVFHKDLEKSMQLVYMDHRGFSRKNGEAVEADFALDKLLADIDRLRRELNQDKIKLIGHSIHALLVLEYAKRYAQHVDKLILSAASPIAGSKLFDEANRYLAESVDPERKAKLAANISQMANMMSEQPEKTFVNRMLQFGPMLWFDAGYDAAHLWEGVRLDPLGSDVIWNRLFADYDIPDLSHLAMPVLLLLGRYDYFNPPHLWDAHRAKFQHLTVRIFEKSGHTPSFEEPSLFNAEVGAWLSDNQ